MLEDRADGSPGLMEIRALISRAKGEICLMRLGKRGWGIDMANYLIGLLEMPTLKDLWYEDPM